MVVSISLFKKEDVNTVKLLVKGFDETYVNSLRRTMGAEVPVLAIEDVELRQNNSILYDEMLALRLGLITLTTDLKTYEMAQPGEPLNAKNSLKITLKGKGPGYLYASQIKTKDPKVAPVYGKTPITKLLDGQEVELEATAVLGKGKVHAKWSPGLFFHHHVTKTTIPKQPNSEEQKEILATFPPGLFEVKAGKLSIKNTDRAMEMEDFENFNPLIKIEKTPDFLFGIESWGQLSPKDLITEGVKTFDGLLEQFQDVIKTIK